MEILFFIGMILGQHCGYAIRTEMRGGVPIVQTSIQRMITTMSFPAWISLFVWGFLNLKWYIVIGTFLFCAFLITPFVFNKSRLPAIFKMKTLTEFSLLICGTVIWVSYLI